MQPRLQNAQFKFVLHQYHPDICCDMHICTEFLLLCNKGDITKMSPPPHFHAVDTMLKVKD